MTTPLLVVTDLDGTLLDHHDYHFEPVLPVIARLKQAGIPVVANTSKTRAEWLAMRANFHDNRDAFVTENGSAIHFPNSECEVLGKSREEILDLLAPLRRDYQFEGFADWTNTQVQEHTGLSKEAAERAQQREYSEPLVWKGGDGSKQSFRETLQREGLMTLEGGRFLHVLGQTDKGRPLAALRRYYGPNTPTVIALGDSPNDIAMLQQADIGVVIASPIRDQLHVETDHRLTCSTKDGPEGWAEVLTQLLDELL
ncbi:MAG: HAD-IIB family hydrolase [Verrucomicrobiaceae bacterium]|jgi:mannosyl-3-phosphoglycerate phosphatase|nr:HAD-IIB family hydrolase [bacterium]MDB4627135.1 HAD-IIB family hydrolase [bacterium]NCF94559.1 HAD-IIB family hydrolase [Verrucomicrobiaceae bacterium]